MTFKSFRQDKKPAPSHYRTPSPPHRDVSPCSPHIVDDATPSLLHRPSVGSGDKNIANNKDLRDGNKHGRKGDARNLMDAFASIALAVHSERSPPEQAKDQQRAQIRDSCTFERPAKRSRSEILSSPNSSRISSGLVTSDIETAEIRRQEAELLLHFSRTACFAVLRSPRIQQELSSPSTTRSATICIAEPAASVLTPYKTAYIDGGRQQPHVYGTHNEQCSVDIRSPRNLNRKKPSRDGSCQDNGIFSSPVINKSLSRCSSRSGNVQDNDQPQQNQKNAEKDYFQQLSRPLLAGEVEQGPKHSSSEHDTSLPLIHKGSAEAEAGATAKFREGTGVNTIEEVINAGSDGIRPEISHNHTFLDGIEEAARGNVAKADDSQNILPTNDKPSLATAAEMVSTPSEAQNRAVANSTLLKGKAQAPPSVCAACNFSRNALTLETENDALSWISCDACKSWFHFACAGFKSEREVRGVDKYRCRKCKPLHGNTTYVRKSARAHSAIDYAGLNEGVLKTSDENPEHHYIKPIKDGIIKFNAESFARMRPELVTADYFEKGDGMKEPIVIPAFLNPRPRAVRDFVPDQEILEDGSRTTAETGMDSLQDQSVLEQWLSREFEYQTVPDHGQDALDMVIPQDLTVRKVSQLYGPEEKIEVIDVKSQNGEDKKWNMRRWVDYYESTGSKVVRNVISLEVSQSKLGRLIRRPKIVRELDLQDSVWPADLIAKGDYPKVQFYCLMSVADCYTDFHIDFGGSSVFYHILKGKKTFFFIPPHEKHLKKYEEWCMSPAQNWTFLGDQTKECYRVDLSEGDTMLIPAGWIHAVWTPEDSLVIGGNFLTRMHYEMQIRVAQIEKATGVARKFRYPHFQKLLWYTAMKYLDDDPLPDSVTDSLLAGQTFHRRLPAHHDFDAWGSRSNEGPENYHARYYSKAELDGLPELGRYLQRTALIALGNITEGISAETRNAVKRSIPKGNGEPLEVVKKFALWYTWKRGNEPIPHWAYPDHVPEGGAPELTEKKLSAAALRRLDREAALQAWRIAPDRQSTRRRSQPLNLYVELTGDAIETNQGLNKDSRSSSGPAIESGTKAKRSHHSAASQAQSSGTTSTTLNKRRVMSGAGVSTNSSPTNKGPACEMCRKRRRACKHRAEIGISAVAPVLQEPVAEGLIVVNSSQLRPKDPFDTPSKQASGIAKTLDQLTQLPFDTSHCGAPTDHEERGSLQMSHVEIFRRGGKTELRDSFAEQAIDTITTQPAVLNMNASAVSSNVDLNALSPIRTPGRTKACKDCRKSKRRCVHDENGNEDPIKVAEASLPRSSSIKKRKLSGESAEDGSVKKVKKPASSGVVVNFSQSQSATESFAPNSLTETIEQASIEDSAPPHKHAEAAYQDLQQLPSVTKPNSEAPSTEVPPNRPSLTAASPNPVVEDEVHLIATSPLSELKFEPDYESLVLSSNLSFQQPAVSSLVSPPASTHTNDERASPNTSKTQNITPSATSSSSRHSSRPAKTVQRYTPESGPARRASSSSVGLERGPLGQSGSPVVGTNVRASSSAIGEGKRGMKSRVGSEIEADEESMRLIRELQAQDLGLRRRGRG
ncbi:Lysine-specific demethylase 7A [Lambiella insularis]|nr:Lysine-specific demethylase 7A [Lambiella insularis]